jgi:hypothetical protein
MTGGDVCRAHGGAARQTRRAAAVRVQVAAMRREFDAAREQHERELRDWWGDRIVWAADVLGEDPIELTREMSTPYARGMLSLRLPLDVSWPPGLRTEDEPRLRFDRAPRC